MSKRLAMLEKMTSSGAADSFAWYGLAMEYRSLGRKDEALATFRTLREKDASYVPLYLMTGQLLMELGKHDEARAWVTDGIAAAKKKGDDHALSELESLAAELAR